LERIEKTFLYAQDGSAIHPIVEALLLTLERPLAREVTRSRMIVRVPNFPNSSEFCPNENIFPNAENISLDLT
jgi:hypothetical protein